MGKLIAILTGAVLIGASSIALIGQQSRLRSQETQGEYQHQQLARQIAESGLDRGLSTVRRRMMDADGADNVKMSGGTYSVGITNNEYGDLEIISVGESGGVEHTVASNVIFEAPMESALHLDAEELDITASGSFEISGHDMRAPSSDPGRRGFLSSRAGITGGSAAVTAAISAAFPADNVVGSTGPGSVSQSENAVPYNDVFEAALAQATPITSPFSSQYGTPGDPAILAVAGDFAPTGPFSGSGMLLVDNGNFTSNPDFAWEGLVMVRKDGATQANVDFSNGGQIHGAMVAFEAGAAGAPACEDVPFDISGVNTIPSVPVNISVQVLGAAISYGGSYDMPVTAKVLVDDAEVAPWGEYDKALAGNLNRDGEFLYAPEDTYAAGTSLTLSASSWYRQSGKSGTRDSHWNVYMEQNSAFEQDQLTVLRDGDDVPNIEGYLGQSSVEDFVADYVDDAGKMTLEENQSIYLFELGSTDPSSAAFDSQDLVVLVTMTRADGSCVAAAAGSTGLNFSISNGAKIQYSPEAIAKIGQRVPAIEARSQVVVTKQRAKTLTPKEAHTAGDVTNEQY